MPVLLAITATNTTVTRYKYRILALSASEASPQRCLASCSQSLPTSALSIWLNCYPEYSQPSEKLWQELGLGGSARTQKQTKGIIHGARSQLMHHEDDQALQVNPGTEKTKTTHCWPNIPLRGRAPCTCYRCQVWIRELSLPPRTIL